LQKKPGKNQKKLNTHTYLLFCFLRNTHTYSRRATKGVALSPGEQKLQRKHQTLLSLPINIYRTTCTFRLTPSNIKCFHNPYLLSSQDD